MGTIKDSLTFDDVTLIPKYSSILPSEAITDCQLSDNLNLQIKNRSPFRPTAPAMKRKTAEKYYQLEEKIKSNAINNKSLKQKKRFK